MRVESEASVERRERPREGRPRGWRRWFRVRSRSGRVQIVPLGIRHGLAAVPPNPNLSPPSQPDTQKQGETNVENPLRDFEVKKQETNIPHPTAPPSPIRSSLSRLISSLLPGGNQISPDSPPSAPPQQHLNAPQVQGHVLLDQESSDYPPSVAEGMVRPEKKEEKDKEVVQNEPGASPEQENEPEDDHEGEERNDEESSDLFDYIYVPPGQHWRSNIGIPTRNVPGNN